MYVCSSTEITYSIRSKIPYGTYVRIPDVFVYTNSLQYEYVPKYRYVRSTRVLLLYCTRIDNSQSWIQPDGMVLMIDMHKGVVG